MYQIVFISYRPTVIDKEPKFLNELVTVAQIISQNTNFTSHNFCLLHNL